MSVQEEKQLLVQDLSARLPYNVQVDITYSGEHGSSDRLKVCSEGCLTLNTDVLGVYIEDEIYLKPYLRPMSSMTDKEMDKLFEILNIDKDGKDEDWIKINDFLGIKFFFPTGKWVENVAEAYDYLNAIHIDYRGLIPMGLALEAPEGMYNT